MNNNSDITPDELKTKPILGQAYGEDEDDHSIELASIEISSSKKKKKKKKSSKTGDNDAENDSQKKKKKKKSKKTKEGKRSRKIKKDSQSSSIAELFDSISSLNSFAFDEASHDSDQDSCYKSTGALTPTGTGSLTPTTGMTPVGKPKKKLAAPSSAPLGNEKKKKVPASLLSLKQSDFISRRERRRANMGADASLLNNSYHGITPTSRKRMTVKMGNGFDNSNHSLPDLFASSPASSSGTPTSSRIRRRISAKTELDFHSSLPDLFSFSPGALDGGSPLRRRRPRVNSADKKAWTPRAPTLTRRISSRSLCDDLNGGSLHSFASAKSDSSDDPFKSPTTENSPSVPKIFIPDHNVGESSDDDVGLMYETPFVSPSGRTAKKRTSGSNGERPFELVTPSRQTSTMTEGGLPSNMSDSGDLGVPITPGSMPVQELDNDASASSFATDGFLSPLPNMLKPKASADIPMTSPNSMPVQGLDSDTSEHGPLQKFMMDNVVGENDNTDDDDDDDERSLDMDELLGLPPSASDNTKEDAKEASQEYSDSSFGFDSPFGGSKAQKSKNLTSKVVAASGAMDEGMNRSFKEALSVDPFDSDQSSVEASPPQSSKRSFSGKVLTTSSLNEEMNRSFHDALDLDPFEAPEYINDEEFGTERDDDVVEELDRSFQDTLNAHDFAAEEFQSMEFETKSIPPDSDSKEDAKCKVATVPSWTVPESPTVGDTKTDAVVRDIHRIGDPQEIKTQDDDASSSDSSFGSEDSKSLSPPKKAGIPKKANNASLSRFMDKNSDHNKALEQVDADETSKNSKSVSSFEKLKLRVRHRLRSAMSVVSVGSKSSQATKSSTEPDESLPSINDTFWNIHKAKSTTATHRSAGRLRMDGRVAVGRRVRKSETRTSSDGMSIASESVSKTASKDKQTKRKKKKNAMLGQSDHSTETLLASGKERGSTKKKTKSKSSRKVSKSKPKSDDMFLAFVTERKPKDDNVGDVFSC